MIELASTASEDKPTAPAPSAAKAKPSSAGLFDFLDDEKEKEAEPEPEVTTTTTATTATTAAPTPAELTATAADMLASEAADDNELDNLLGGDDDVCACCGVPVCSHPLMSSGVLPYNASPAKGPTYLAYV